MITCKQCGNRYNEGNRLAVLGYCPACVLATNPALAEIAGQSNRQGSQHPIDYPNGKPLATGDTFTYGIISVRWDEADGYWTATFTEDKKRWAPGKTMNEAIGSLWRMWHEQIREQIILDRDFGPWPQEPRQPSA